MDGTVLQSTATASASSANITVQNTFHVTGELDSWTEMRLRRIVDAAVRKNLDDFNPQLGGA